MDKQNTAYIISNLQSNGLVFKQMLEGLDAEEYLYRSEPGKWCLLEVLCHLRDEETEDFRARISVILEHPKKAFTPIDPEAWVVKRKYAEQDYHATLIAFLKAREESINWLHELSEPNWEDHYIHEHLDKMSAALFLENWLAHDYLHIRQINRIKYQYLAHKAENKLNYAGDF